jgi:ribokinase
MAGNVVVVGSLSVDFVMRVPRRPEKGETISGFDFNTFVGGKGNNQALAAARAGAKVHMVGCVGKDSYGDRLAQTLERSGVSTQFLFRDPDAGTGIANIYVDPEGDNSIVIVPQANASLTVDEVSTAMGVICDASVVMLQLEIPMETVVHVAKAAHASGVKVMLNPAPAPPSGTLPDELLKSVDLLIPNQSEAELLTGVKVHDRSSAHEAAKKLQAKGVREVIVTLGDKGALIVDTNGIAILIPAFQVTPVDTTAAGDAFCGALAAGLASGMPLRDAVRLGCAAGALATTHAGAEPSLPTRAEIDHLAGNAASV